MMNITTLPISIVTACRNCERYVEKTILSVVGQDYPLLQYIVVDGASTDSTLKIVNKHQDRISKVISEPDSGQYHGIQKGMNLCDGEVMAYLNADDTYYPWTFSVVNEVFMKFPEVEWIIGQPGYMNAESQCIRISGNAGTAYPREYIRNGWFRSSLAGYLQQESMFWRRSLWEKTGGLSPDYKYAADFELWTRFAEHTELFSVAVPLALFRKRPGEQKSSLGKIQYDKEVSEICRNRKPPSVLWRSITHGNQIREYIYRMLVWKKCNVIAYSEKESGWVIRKNTIRPISRVSLSEAILHVKL
jgi:glycosyltransferase involved in cell wall biosynthesis